MDKRGWHRSVHLRVCKSLGALKEVRTNIKASWAEIVLRLSLTARMFEPLTSTARYETVKNSQWSPQENSLRRKHCREAGKGPLWIEMGLRITSHLPTLSWRIILAPTYEKGQHPKTRLFMQPIVRGEAVDRRIGCIARQKRSPPSELPYCGPSPTKSETCQIEA